MHKNPRQLIVMFAACAGILFSAHAFASCKEIFTSDEIPKPIGGPVDDEIRAIPLVDGLHFETGSEQMAPTNGQVFLWWGPSLVPAILCIKNDCGKKLAGFTPARVKHSDLFATTVA